MENEEVKKLLGEISEGMKEEVVKTLLADENLKKGVMDSLLKELPNRKDIFGGDKKDAKAELAESKEKSAEFIKAVFNGDVEKVKSMTVGTGADGGYLVPDYFGTEIIRLVSTYGVVRRNARVYPVSGTTVKLPTIGSVTAYRIAEKGVKTASKATVAQVTITIKKLACFIVVSDELLADATGVTVDLLAELAGEAIALKEDEWGLLGLGAGEGIFQNTSVPVVTMAVGKDTYAEATADDLLDLQSAINENALAGAKYYMSLSVFNAFRKLKDTTGQYIVQSPAGGQPATIWNAPVELSAVMPKTSDGSQASKKFVAFANLRYMILADRQQYTVDVSNQATVVDDDGSTAINLFQQDMSAVRVVERIDIELAQADKAFAVLKTAAT